MARGGAAAASLPPPLQPLQLLLLLALGRAASADQGAEADFSSPVIGIFSLPVSGIPGRQTSASPCGAADAGEAASCELLPASYVKFVEAAGGRVVPVSSSAGYEEVQMLARSLNGFLFTGGPDMPLPAPMRWVLDRSLALHRAGGAPGESLPIWGSCLGFELMVEYVAPGALQGDLQAFNMSAPLKLTPAAGGSRLLGGAPTRVLDALTRRSTTFNMHHRGVVPQRWSRLPALGRTFDVLSTTDDANGVTFVSTIEGRGGLPWYAVQWHPEKNAFENGLSPDGTPYERIDHGPEAVAAAQYVAGVFISEARRSRQRFANAADLASRLVYGRPTTGSYAPMFVEAYLLRYPAPQGGRGNATLYL